MESLPPEAERALRETFRIAREEGFRSPHITIHIHLPQPELRIYTHQQVIRKFPFGERTLRQWAETGKLRSYKPGKEILYLEEDIRKCLTDHEKVPRPSRKDAP